MLDKDKKQILKKIRNRYYYYYPLFLIGLYFSMNDIIDITLITIFVLFIIIHHGYYFNELRKIEDVEVSF